MSIPESFSKGIPIISTELGNPGQMIKESGGGIVYRVNDFDSFRNAIEKMMRNTPPMRAYIPFILFLLLIWIHVLAEFLRTLKEYVESIFVFQMFTQL